MFAGTNGASTLTPSAAATFWAIPTKAREVAVSTTTKTFSYLPSPATTPPPPTTSVSPEVDEKDCGLVRSNAVLPAVRTPGGWAAVDPVEQAARPEEQDDPLFHLEPALLRLVRVGFSSQRSTAIGRPERHVGVDGLERRSVGVCLTWRCSGSTAPQ